MTEEFRIQIVENAKAAAKHFAELASTMAQAASVADKADWGNKKLTAMSKEVQAMASAELKLLSVYSKGQQITNDKVMAEQKLQTEISKTSAMDNKASAELSKKLLIQQQVITETNKSVTSEQRLQTEKNKSALVEQRVQTEMSKTAAQAVKLEMAQLRQATAIDKAAQATAKANAPYNQLRSAIDKQSMAIKNAITSNSLNEVTLGRMADKYKRLQSELNGVHLGYSKLTGETKLLGSATEISGRAFASFLGNLANNMFQNAIYSMGAFAKEVSSAGIAMDGLRNTMMAATGGWAAGGREMKWMLDMSERLGLSFGDVSDSYAKFMTSFTRSGGTTAQSRQIFEDISSAMVSLHLPAERMQGVFIALEQMANKGTVQAEELKRQLGNALPGAFELAAESMGILPAKLMDLMKKGEVFSKDFLPNFARTVKDVLGQSLGIAVNQFNASLGRLATATSLLKMELGQGLNALLNPLVQGFTGVVNALMRTAMFFNENSAASAALKAVMIPLTAIVLSFASAVAISATSFISAQIAGSAFFVSMSAGAQTLIADAVALNASLGGIPLIIGVLATALAGLAFYISDVNSKVGDIRPYIDLRGQIVEAAKSITTLNLATQDGKDDLQNYKSEFPQLTEYLLTTNKQFKDLTDSELTNIATMGMHDAKMRAMAERTAELASWQSTLSATWGVAWDNIKKWTTIAGQNILWTIGKIMDGIKALVSGLSSTMINMAKGLDAIGNIASAAGSKLGIAGAPLKAWGNQVSALSDGYLNFGQNVKKAGDNISSMGAGIKSWYSNTAFGIDTTNKKLENANTNAINKLKAINKGSMDTVKALRQAQRAVAGLDGSEDSGDSGSSSGSGKGRGKSSHTKAKVAKKAVEADSAWEKLGKELSAQEELIQSRLADGKSIDDLVPKYMTLKAQHDSVAKTMQELTNPVNQQTKGWKDLKTQLTEVEDTYKYMLSNSNAFTADQVAKERAIMKNLKATVQYNEALENYDNLTGITNRNATKMSDSIVDNLFDNLDGGLTFWERFKNIGLQTVKSISAEWLKQEISLLSKGFQAGFIQNITGNQLQSGWQGLMSAFQHKALPTTAGQASAPAAISSAASTAAGAIPDAAGALTGAATSLATATPILVASAPALIAMSSALSTIAVSAGQAAVAMASLAIATAANSVAGIPLLGAVLAPMAAIATGAAIGAGSLLAGAGMAASSVMSGAGQGIGGLMSGSSKVIPHAKGGIVSSPTMFPMSGGNIGLAGEAGSEVIAPARRMSNGDLGVGAIPSTVNIYNQGNATIETVNRPNGDTDVFIRKVNNALGSERTQSGFARASGRQNSRGVTAA